MLLKSWNSFYIWRWFWYFMFWNKQSIFHVLHRRLLFPILITTVDMIVNNSFCCKKKIQIVCCSCTQRKLSRERVPFYTEKRFYDNFDMVFVAPCPQHPYFKVCTRSRFENKSSNCLNLQKGRCNNCKIICFNITFFVDKIELGHYLDVSSTVDIVPIETYREKMSSMLLF